MKLLLSKAKNTVRNKLYDGVGTLVNLFDQDNVKKVVWVVSYPRSGNTWLREIIARLNGYEGRKVIPGAHFDRDRVFDLANDFYYNGEKVILVKTHTLDFPKYLFSPTRALRIQNHGFIYIYRHPLDVLISSLNFLYSQKMSEFFFNGDLKSVDELKQTGEIDAYIDHYINKFAIGNNAFTKMCGGSWLDHINAWLKRYQQADQYQSLIIKYEDIHHQPLSTLDPLADLFGKDSASLRNAIDLASTNTKIDQRFFWKQKVGNYRQYLSEKHMREFNFKYRKTLSKLGY
ncbi:sulfotransferase [Thalassoporum mexicanum PCC 7367]|uniref:sulfotransferase domain-containing protein n=1 Tax=Thalassoporum mexicanum TaxID=3457544 RepID=UPI00029F8A22|nr:sulfotransferase domain-containing protein [Pseudanabaena sp. PCC 7367]AFY71863.1 sulfotransferase [Pseudanabaena sp. PCC 7367]